MSGKRPTPLKRSLALTADILSVSDQCLQAAFAHGYFGADVVGVTRGPHRQEVLLTLSLRRTPGRQWYRFHPPEPPG